MKRSPTFGIEEKRVKISSRISSAQILLKFHYESIF